MPIVSIKPFNPELSVVELEVAQIIGKEHLEKTLEDIQSVATTPRLPKED